MSTRMSSTTPSFTCFNRLPIELRLRIWEHVMRPAVAQAHWVQPNPESRGMSNRFLKFVPNIADAHRHYFMDGPNNNTSGYCIDSTIWAVCRESQTAIRRYYQRMALKDHKFKASHWPLPTETLQYASFCTKGDLFIQPFIIDLLGIVPFGIEPFGMEAFDIEAFDVELEDVGPFGIEPFGFEPIDIQNFDTEPDDFMPFGLESSESHLGSWILPRFDKTWGPIGLENVAFVYHPAIITYLSHQLNQTRDENGTAQCPSNSKTIWFIDLNLKRTHYAPTQEQAEKDPKDLAEFWVGAKRFVEVLVEVVDDEHVVPNYVWQKAKGVSPIRSIETAAMLNEYIAQMRIRKSMTWDPIVKVLAFEN